jgi:hypothetical protein
VATTLNNMAVLAEARGHCDKAKALFERALSILEPALGPVHPSVIACRASRERCSIRPATSGTAAGVR